MFWNTFFFLAPNTRDLDVFLRKQESGFGFRVLGGDGPDQPVSETAHSYLIVLLLEWSCSVILVSHHPIRAVQWWQNWSNHCLPFRDQELVRITFIFSPLCGLRSPRFSALSATEPVLGHGFSSGRGRWSCFYGSCCVSEPSDGPCWRPAFAHCHLVPAVALAQAVPGFNDLVCWAQRRILGSSWVEGSGCSSCQNFVRPLLFLQSSETRFEMASHPFIPCFSHWIFRHALSWRQLGRCHCRHPWIVCSPRAGFRRCPSIFKHA